MATYSPLARAIVSLATASFEREGFGTPAFFTPHRYTKNRVLIVTKDSYLDELPLASKAYKAAETAFSQSNGLSQLFICRVEADVEITLEDAPVENDVYTIDVEVNDGDKVSTTHLAPATPTQEGVLAALEAAILANTDVAAHITTTLTGTGETAKLTISNTLPEDYFIVSNLNNLVDSYVTTETATEAFAEASDENNNFYAVTTSDKSETWLTELTEAVNAQRKQIWATTSELVSLEALTDPATDLIGKLAQGNYLRGVFGYHQDAETKFPELAALAFNLPFQAGSIVWGNNITSGLEGSRNSKGSLLTVTQKQALLDRNAFFWDEQGGLTFLNSDVKTSSGERPENVRGKDNMEVDIVASISELLLNQVGRKIPYNNRGIAQIEGVLDSTLQTYVQRGFIENNYTITSPDARTIAGGIKATQKLSDMKFTAQLTGAITMVDPIQGVLQLDEVVQ